MIKAMIHRAAKPLLIRVALILGIGALPPAARAAGPSVEFNRDIRPILSENCFVCHGPDASHRKGKLRLDIAEAAMAPRKESGPAVVPGKPEESALIKRINEADDDERMPPRESRKALTDAQKQTLRRWIEQGAKYQQHWAFIPPARPEIPKASPATTNPIDALLIERLSREGFKFSPPADRPSLLRRVSLDLTGLPPTLKEIDAFLADSSADAYEKQVDRLLASPRYGEHMAVWWLDAARYADSNGYQNDFLRQQWRWRDWVIEAFNRNEPFDQFTIEQIGGDQLPNATLDQKIATGFHRNHRTVTEAGSISEEWRTEYVIDRVATTGQVWLGVTIGCARCHDHKFDPFTQKEFYQLAAFFNSIAEEGLVNETPGNVPPKIVTPTREQQARLGELDKAVAAAEAESKIVIASAVAAQVEWERTAVAKPSEEIGAGMAWRVPLDGSLNTIRPGQEKPAAAVWNGSPSPEWKKTSALGSAIRFAGKDGHFAEVPETPMVDGSKPFAAAAWVKLDDLKHGGTVLSRMDEGAAFRGFDLSLNEGKLTFHLIHHWQDNVLKVTSNQPLSVGRWQHVVVSYDGTRKPAGVALYIDGHKQEITVNENSLTGTTETAQPLRLGLRTRTLALLGELRDVRFYERTLRDDDIKALMFAPYLAMARAPVSGRTPEQSAALADWYQHTQHAPSAAALAKVEEARRVKRDFEAQLPTTMIMAEREKPRDTFILRRGEYDKPGEKVTHGTPAMLPPLPPGVPANRLALGRWLVAKENPLTARVIANRMWERFFGVGLVKTSDDFGSQGEPPANQALLDWLACELQQPTVTPPVAGQPAKSWDLKAFQKLLVTSAAYRQSSAATPVLLERDPENRLLASGPRFRLSAEVIRDQALAISGTLVEKLGGPSVKPYQPSGVWEELIMVGENQYKPDTGDSLHRRTLYTFVRRTAQQPSLAIFDAPSREVCVIRRGRTNTPLQALGLMNDVTYVEASRHFAERMIQNGGTTARDRLMYGFRIATARSPRPEELAVLERGLTARLAVFRQNPADAKRLLEVGDKKSAPAIDPAELAAYTTAASVILNLDEVVTHQ
jgi:mono/diheme cytochrome c family protein